MPRRRNRTGSIFYSGRHGWCFSTPAGVHRTGYDSRDAATGALDGFLATGELPQDRRYRSPRVARAGAAVTIDDVAWARRYVARLSRRHPRHAEDIEAEAIAALWTAALDLDSSTGVQLRDFARARVWGAVMDFLRGVDRSMSQHGRPAKAFRVTLDEAGWESLPARDQPIEDEIEQRSRARLLVAQVLSLPERHGRAFTAYVLEHRPLADIGKELGVTESRACQLVKAATKAITEAKPIRAIWEAA